MMRMMTTMMNIMWTKKEKRLEDNGILSLFFRMFIFIQ